MRIDWDLSERHTLDEVAWKEGLDLRSTSVEPVDSVNIRLPAGEVLRMPDRAKRVILYRRADAPEALAGPEGKVLDRVEVYSEPLAVDDAYARAVGYAEQFDLPKAPLDGWRKRRNQGGEAATDRTGTTTDRPLGGKGGPIPYVELNYSPNEDRPWIPSVQLYWPEG